MGVGYSMYILFVSLFLLGILNVCNAERLRYNFYKKTCPQANQIVKQIITSKTRTNPALGAHLIRMQFHDCFVRVTIYIYSNEVIFRFLGSQVTCILTLFVVYFYRESVILLGLR